MWPAFGALGVYWVALCALPKALMKTYFYRTIRDIETCPALRVWGGGGLGG